MRKLTLVLILLIQVTVWSQNPNSNSFRLSSSASHDLYIRFENEIINTQDSDFVSQANLKITGFETLSRTFGIQLEKGILLSEEQFTQLSQKEFLVSKTTDKVQNLQSIFQIKIDNPTNQNLYQLGLQLQKLKGVVYCSLISSTPIRPAIDIPPTTTNYQSQQGYINANPGVNMQYAWNNLQTGSGITIRNLEYGVNLNHEEFAGGGASIAAGMTINSSASTDYTEHGTAVFGVVYAHKGTYGVSGLAYGATAMILYPEWQQSGYNRIYAVSQAVGNAQTGDVIIYEMQDFGQNNNYVPAEYNQVVWDLTVAANAIGAVVVAAAGNGNQNLDGIFYTDYMLRGDSGAIIVGAGSSTIFHNKLYFSTYGSRVNVQGWGENVYTTGFFSDTVGSFKVGNDFNQSYSSYFNGTSSATPIVASCVAVLQSYHHSLTGTYLTSLQMRSILQQTGIAQTNVLAGAIGPFPNMQAAMQLIYNNYLLDVKSNPKPAFSIFPNPARDVLNIAASSEFSEGDWIVLYNSLGQKCSLQN
ncbi:S8 family serine peptidase [Flavobacterium sp.]|uniref:S8 family serine peptidase n=1 Tax=Flavobacterium sp. TaxID=239 RepID=UPI002617CE27|nr:S8 family serine peptidase [Flavobacterium sp.]MDD3005358.1 S8 family serine peptidase [Flavobacterium sp.]